MLSSLRETKIMSNTLGERLYYRYVDDNGAEFKYQTDSDLGTAVGAVLNDTLPNLPRRFKPRGVYCQAIVDGRLARKFLICPTTDNGVYAENASQVVAIDGTNFRTTGRRGEQLSFGGNPPAPIVNP